MGSQRIASSLINRPYHPPGWGEPALGEEPGEGEDGYTNPPLEDGYSELSDGVIVDMQATLRELFDNPDLEMNPESFHLQSLGEPIEFYCSPNSGGEYEGQEGGPGESEYIDPLCACEQSLYWATEAGYDCQTLNVIYFYHPDYLGSVEYVTDMRGEPYQFFLNTPWGENLENQFAKNYTSFSSRFRFNGKEWDEETGNFYYGARYYDPKISVWLSVDPLAHEFPGWSSYNFTMNNPLNLVDPDGLSAKPPVNVEDFFDPGNTWDDDDGSWVLSDDYEWIPQGNTPYEGSTLPELEIDGGSKPVSANAEEKSETSNETQPNSFDRKSQPSVSIKVSLGSYPTPFADFSLSAKQKVQESQNSAVGITLDRDGELQSTSWTTVFGTQTINMDGGVSTSYGGVSTGFNSKNQMTIGISSPSFQGRSYSASMSMNPRQFANSAFLAMNLIAFRRFPSSPLFPAFVP